MGIVVCYMVPFCLAVLIVLSDCVNICLVTTKQLISLDIALACFIVSVWCIYILCAIVLMNLF